LWHRIMMIRKQLRSCLVLLQIAVAPLVSISLCQAQLGTLGNDGGNAQGPLPCDDRFFLCAGGQSTQMSPGASPYNNQGASPYNNQGASQYNAGGRSDLPEADTRYDFGNGQPLNLSPRDYPYQPQSGGPPLSAASPVRFRPEPLTEFQKFVAADTGKVLPIFGGMLFRDVPATFAPLDKVPVPENYVVGPGDELMLRAWGSIAFYLRVTVDRSGSIYIPHVGQVQVAGIRFSELRNYLDGQIATSFKKFDLSVEMGHLRAIQIFVVGRTRRPGSYTVSSLSSLVDALFVSGGPSSTGSMRRIEVKRGSSVVTELDLYDFLLNGNKSKDIPLLPGDVIYVLPAGPRVALTGSVSQPAIFEIRRGETVGDILAMAGGLTSLATMESGELERIDSSGARHVIEVHFDEAGLKMALADGDILRVLSIVPRFDNAVTLRGNVANPGRYAWHAGMRITDLIPNKDALLTRNYWKRKNSLVFVRMDGQAQAQAQAQTSDNSGGGPPAGKTDVVDSSRDLTQDDDEGNSATAASMPQSEDKSEASPPKRPTGGETNGSSNSGQSIASQTGAPSERFPVSNRVEPRVPEIDWDYAVIERLNADDLATSLKPFNLGRAVLEKGEKDNLELQPGDIVTIFSQADIRVPQSRQATFVRLEGEFQAAGVYSVRPGETLRELVERAGGLTRQAYLFGSAFTRESTRRQQQAQLDEYSSDLERDIERAASTRSSSAVSVQEAATSQASLESQRALAAKLRLMRASGRIVLDIDPESTGMANIPDIPLEDGDSFIVPSRPANVKVVGAVYDQNAFIFEAPRRAGDYLQLAGGIARSGDSRHAFIIRADGSVVSRKSKRARSRGGLEKLAMNPGDTVVVPETIDKTTLLRGLTDWSAVFGQFGLGAAAINVLR
jgi:protein involved in polysaccharide export with SLBB domain